jgi:hypothetical protein
MKKLLTISLFLILFHSTSEHPVENYEMFNIGRFLVQVDEVSNSYRVYCDGRWSGWHRRVITGINEIKE